MTDRASHSDAVSAPTVDLVYDASCPNVEGWRAAIRTALQHAGLALEWREWDRAAPTTPADVRSYGSPTFLVNGRDIAGTPEAVQPTGNSCRVYASEEDARLTGVPSSTTIVAALRRAAEPP